MSKKTNHNPVYFLTTLSVYLGLVLVGASPQILAQAKLAKQSNSHSFEVRVKTNSVFSKLEFKSNFEYQDVLPFAFLGGAKFSNRNWDSEKHFRELENQHKEILAENNQVLLKIHFPRASI